MEEDCVTAIIQVLNKLLDPNVKINESQITTLVKCLTEIPGDVIEPEILKNVLVTWLSTIVSRWEVTTNLDPAIIKLIINLSMYLFSDEEAFVTLNNGKVINSCLKLSKKFLVDMQDIPSTDYVLLLSSFLKHDSGCLWFKSSTYWSEIMLLVHSKTDNIDFVKEGYKFITKLIEKSVSIDPDFCSGVIRLIMVPITNIANFLNTKSVEDMSSFLQRKASSFQLTIAVLENVCEARDIQIYKAILKVANDTNFESCLIDLRKKILDKYLCFPVTTILYILGLYEVVVNQDSYSPKRAYYDYVIQISTKMLNVLQDVGTNEPISLSVKLCSIGQKCCYKLGPLAPTLLTKEKIPRPHAIQLLFNQIYPCIYVSVKLVGRETVYIDGEDIIRERFATKALNIILPITYRSIFLLRNNCHQNFSLADATFAMEHVLDLKKYFGKEQKTIALNIFMHNLEDFSSAISCKCSKLLGMTGRDTYILNLMKSIISLIEDSDFNWKDILEIVMLIEITITILKAQQWENDVYVYGLKLISLAFYKHFSMNMVFLTDQYDEVFFEDVTALIAQKLKHDSCNVRCSAIEAVRAISKSIKKQFCYLAKMVMEKHLPLLVFDKAINDKKPFVRAEALVCLQELTKLTKFWNMLLSKYNVFHELTECLYNGTDASVRGEAATLISTICEYQEICPNELFKLYDIMSYTVMHDSDQNAKIKALQFWKKITDDQLTVQGMIDGEFPDMTFSKELKKIVVLTEAEVTKRIFKVLEELSKTGCLAVFVSALEDDGAVQEAFMSTMENFIHQLRKYGIAKSSWDITSSEETELELSNAEHTKYLDKILGRETCLPDKFLKVLNKHLFILDTKKSISSSEQLVKTLNKIFSVNG